MRLLFIHSDHLEFSVTEEVGDLAETEGVPLEGRLEDCVATFISVESDDAEDTDAVVANAADEIRDVTGQLQTDRVVLYPYAHLSDDLADPEVATRVMRDLEVELDDEFELLRAPFGWYKRFEVACKGHPLSELSRHVAAHREAAEVEAPAPAPSEWHVMTPAGELLEPSAAKAAVGDDMRAFLEAEVEGRAGEGGEAPPHVELMREKQLVGYDELSDAGNLRWYPRGKLVRDVLMDYVSDLVVGYGGMPVETPIMYDLGARAIDEHAGKFGERQYRFESGDRRMMLRFAACFGQFSIMRDMYIAEKDLPLRVYEMSTYSFRREQRGELVGLKRLRAFTMPDMHTATRDMDQAREELRKQAALALSTGDDLGLNYEPAIRMTAAFFADNRDWVADVVAEFGKPALLEVLPERNHYWSAKIDFAVIDSLGRPMENPTVQIDVESAERFDITYHADEAEHHPPILHYSPSGSIERVTAALLETAAKQDVPRLPTWLAPTQLRFIPVTQDHAAFCLSLADRLGDAGVRADVDDREESVGKRIALAETDWVPYYVVVGDREVDGDTLGVNVRAEGQEVHMTVDELEALLVEALEGFPHRPLYLPRRVSRHPRFV
ncbi:MAG: threonine--tRNA ligase [Halobacteriales archaeon]